MGGPARWAASGPGGRGKGMGFGWQKNGVKMSRVTRGRSQLLVSVLVSSSLK